MTKRNKNIANCIMLPLGSKQAKKYVCEVGVPGINLKDKKTEKTLAIFETVSEHTLSGAKVYVIYRGPWYKQIIWFDKKGNIVISKPFVDVVIWLSHFVILKVWGEIKIMESPRNNPKLIFKTGKEMFGNSSEYVTLYSHSNNRVLVEVKNLRVYSNEFTEFEISTKAGLIVVKSVGSDKRKLVRFKDYSESVEYDNVWLYKYANGNISSDYVVVKDNGKFGIMRTKDFHVTFIPCRNITPINNEYMFIHNDGDDNIMRLVDGKIAKW